MPISNSLIMRNAPVWGRGGSKNDSYYSSSYGCSEFPAHDNSIYDYISLGFYLFHDTQLINALPLIFGKEYSAMEHIKAWAEFISDLYVPFEQKDVPFFRPFTWGEYLAIKKTKALGGDIIPDTATGISTFNVHGVNVPSLEVGADAVIGLKTFCNNIRRTTGAYYRDDKGSLVGGCNRARKTQLGHTAYRFMWSGGWPIPIFALKLKKLSDERGSELTNLDCLWLATKFEFAIHRQYHDYGDLFYQDSGYLSDKEFKNRFFSVKLNDYVMNHFAEEQNPMATELGLSKSDSNDSKMFRRIFVEKTCGYSVPAVRDLANALNSDEYFNRVVDEVKAARGRLGTDYETLKFKFCKPLFKSTAQGVCYSGILKPDSKLNRIVFKDEENSVLSVLRESKFIEICK